MWPFSGKHNKSERTVDVSKPIENPALQAAFRRHVEERSEASVTALGQALNSSIYLVPILTDDMLTSPSSPGMVTIEAGSLIKFMNCKNENGESFLPAFTDWHEIQQWVTTEVSTIAMPAAELWQFVLNDANYAGVAINPATVAWTLFPYNIQSLLLEAKNA